MKTKFLITEGRLTSVTELDRFIPENPVTVTGAGGKRFGFRESEAVFIVNAGETRHVFDIQANQRQVIEEFLYRKLGEGWKTISR